MGTTAEKLQRLLDNKVLIANSINAKAGTSFNVNSKFSDMATAINNISGSGGTDYLGELIRSKTDLRYLFMWSNLTNVDFLSNYDTSHITHIGYMFYGCGNLTTIPQLNTSNVTDTCDTFSGCTSLTTIPQLDTSNVKEMSDMFYGCSALTSVPQLNTSNVTHLYNMFYNCTNLRLIDFTFYNIPMDLNASNFAYNCTALKALIIRSFGATYSIASTSLAESGIAKGTGYIYVPRSMVDTLKSATNWSIYADQIRALEDYTIDGTTSGALDTNKI